MPSAYKRILLKVSGEALAGDNSFGIEPPFLQGVAAQIAEVARSGTQVAIVVGGGNIFRGMAGAADGFRAARVNLYQTLLVKPDRGVSGLPLTRADWYA